MNPRRSERSLAPSDSQTAWTERDASSLRSMSSTAAATMAPDARPKGQQALRLLRDGKSLANMPSAFRSAPAFANHYHLAKINKLVSQAGLGTPVYNDVEILHADNGECFFSEYLVEQRKRDSANMNRL